MVPFAGYSMPVSYPQGILAEHRQCRESAVLFDVSHMGQLRLTGDDAAAALETLVPVDIVGLAPGKQRYALFTNDGRRHPRRPDGDAARRTTCSWWSTPPARRPTPRTCARASSTRCLIEPLPERALLALQGPKAAAVMARLAPELAQPHLHDRRRRDDRTASPASPRAPATPARTASRSRSPRPKRKTSRARCSPSPRCGPAGLGARDTLRLEAGLCLYGHDIDTTTTPVEAGLTWAIQKVRRPGGERAGGYPGAAGDRRAARRRRAGQAGRPGRPRAGAGARRRAHRRRGRQRDRPRHQRHGRPERRPADRHGLPAGRARRAGHRASTPMSAASASRCA